MPQEGNPLSDEEVATIRRWIAEGAEWPHDFVVREPPKAGADWWSLQPIRDPSPPQAPDAPAAWLANPIDRFVYARIQEAGLQPNPPADRRTLVRRATYDLTGLPATPADARVFVEDDADDAFARLVDRLLASPAYGEQWGRHWLDVVRFGESRGYERNEIINTLWPFRDYVIASFNDDKPFDQLVGEHLAGDVNAGDDTAAQIGSAFLVAGPYDDVGNQCASQAAQIRANTVDEMIRATGEAFLGMTVGCARCHDHKFDPILQSDYYQLYATFAGVRHGEATVATSAERARHEELTKPLIERRDALRAERAAIENQAIERATTREAQIESRWKRDPPKRSGVSESFSPTEAKFVRLISEGNDANPRHRGGFRIDEFEVWSAGPSPLNVALASRGGRATGDSKRAEDFADAYAASLAIDGGFSSFFIAAGDRLTIELPEPHRVDRVVFSSARNEEVAEHGTFTFLAEYRIETSLDGESWTVVADSHDRRPVSDAHRRLRLLRAGRTDDDRRRSQELDRAIREAERELAEAPSLPRVWVGTRVAEDAAGPFHVMIGGDPARPGEGVAPASPAVIGVEEAYRLDEDSSETERRRRLADWITSPKNPLTARVIVNRLWHYHFGTGIVDTPSDFGYMGGRPTHPELLDWLASRLIESGWRLKPIHRLIMASQAYQQSSAPRAEAIAVDADSRLLWRYPPRRLTAEEVRDTALSVAGKLEHSRGGPGFRLYRYLQDNVATYIPLDEPGSATYRRAVYHQNARAAPTDLLAEFDQPDCAFTTPRRSATTTPLQALTMLNHRFTLDMAAAFAERLAAFAEEERVEQAFQLCYGRPADDAEVVECEAFADEHGWPALCRVLLNTSELITVR